MHTFTDVKLVYALMHQIPDIQKATYPKHLENYPKQIQETKLKTTRIFRLSINDKKTSDILGLRLVGLVWFDFKNTSDTQMNNWKTKIKKIV